MTDDRHVREFLERMANEIDVSPVDPRGPSERARGHRAVAKAIVAVVAVVAIVSAGSLGLRSITRSGLGPAVKPSQSLKAIDGAVLGFGGPGGYTVQAPPGWISGDKNHSVVKGEPGTLSVSVWNVERVPRNPCHWKGTLYNPGRSVDDLVGALQDMAIRTATAPTDVTLAGYSGKYLEWSVPKSMVVTGDSDFSGCDVQGNGHRDFVSWDGNGGEGERWQQMAGQVDRLWILNVNGQRLVVDASYSPDTTQAQRDEEDQVVQSLRFVSTP
jgi:hypothetical protein